MQLDRPTDQGDISALSELTEWCQSPVVVRSQSLKFLYVPCEAAWTAGVLTLSASPVVVRSRSLKFLYVPCEAVWTAGVRTVRTFACREHFGVRLSLGEQSPSVCIGVRMCARAHVWPVWRTFVSWRAGSIGVRQSNLRSRHRGMSM